MEIACSPVCSHVSGYVALTNCSCLLLGEKIFLLVFKNYCFGPNTSFEH